MTVKAKETVRPFFDNILIKEIEAHMVTHGGIHVPDTFVGHGKSKPKPIRFANVICTGKGIKDDNGTLHPPALKPGDVVFYPDCDKSMREVRLDGVLHHIGTKDNFVATLMTEEELAVEEPLLDDFESYGKFGVENVEALMATVWIARDKPKEKSDGGIYYPEESVDAQYTVDSGEVKLVGQGFWTKYGPLRKMNCTPGIRVVYHKYGGSQTFLPDGTEIWCFQDKDIFGVEDKKAELGFTPIADRVFIAKDDDEKKIGRIHIPETSKRKDKKQDTGEILAVGPGAWLDTGQRVPNQSTAGDTAVFRRAGGTPIQLGKRKITVIAEKEILFTVEAGAGKIEIIREAQ